MESLKEKNVKAKLYIMCGCPASGKTYTAKRLAEEEGLEYVSRDEVRFSIIKDGDEYFSQEKKVFNEFIVRIQKSLDAGKSVVADATHINEASRGKTLRALNLIGVDVIAVYMRVSHSICSSRNSLREGRTRVPESAMNSMRSNLTMPRRAEGFSSVIIKENEVKESE